MSTEILSEEQVKLDRIESELIDMISDTNSNKLFEKFVEWQEQRNKCNDEYLNFLEDIIKKSSENGND